MTTDERPRDVAPPRSLAPNPEAQRAYAASIAPPPRPRLPQETTGRARFAGGVGGAMMLVGVDLAGLGLLLLTLPLVLGALLRGVAVLLPGRIDSQAAWASVEQLYAGPWPWIVALVGVVGMALVAAGALVSIRGLRRARLARPVRLTFAAFGIALGARIALNVFTVPFSSLVSPLLDLGVLGIGGGIETVGVVLGLVILFAMNVAIASATGMLAWWFVAHLTRPAAPAAESGERVWPVPTRSSQLPH